MADTRKYVQAQTFTLAGAGAIIGATSITLSSFNDIDGTPLAMTDFGTLGQGTLDPGNGTSEEALSFTGVVQNANGTATLSGVSTQLLKYPYTQTSGLSKTHLGGAKFIITNTAGFYDNFTNKGDDETITGLWDFPNNASTPTLGSSYNAPTLPTQIVSKQYVDNQVSGGANSEAVIFNQTAGETLVAGNVCYYKQSDQRWWKADADDFLTSGNVHLGIAQGAATAGNTVSILLYGMDFNQTGLTPGSFYNLSSTAGAITVALQPVYRFIGTAVSATSLMFTPYDTDSSLIPGVSGEALPTGTWVYFKTSDQKWWKTDSDAAATSIGVQLGIVQTTASGADQLITIRIRGVDYTQTSLTLGSTYYLSGTAGGISTSPGASVKPVGVAIAAQQFLMVLSDNAYAVEQNGSQIYAASATGNDTYVITLSPSPTSYVTGMHFFMKADVANTGSATVNVNSLGALTIKKWGQGGKQDLSTGDIQASQIIELVYDGTDLLLLSAQQPRPLFGTGQTTRDPGSSTGTQNIAHGLGVTPRLVKITATQQSTSNAEAIISVGTATSTSNETCTYFGGATLITAQDSTHIIYGTRSDGSIVNWSATLSTLDATNITLNFDTGGQNTIYIQWEAYA